MVDISNKTIEVTVIVTFVLMVAFILFISNSSSSSESFQPYRGWWTNSYARLGSYGYDQPLFEPDVLRRCADGGYMFTSNPQLTDFCKRVPPPMLARIACSVGCNGKPLYMSYSAPAYGCREIPCDDGPGVCKSIS